MRHVTTPWTRRDLGRSLAGSAVVGLIGRVSRAGSVVADSLLGEFCQSLTPDQRQLMVFPFADPRRLMVQNTWAVVPESIASLTGRQQELAIGLVRQVCTPEGFARLTRQRDDDSGGWKHDHLAVFGSPAEPDRCQWVLTGRHLTLRGSTDGKVGGGPIFVGHALAGPDNLWQEVADLADSFQRRLDVASLVAAVNGPSLTVGGLRPAQQAVIRQLLDHWTRLFRTFEVPKLAACLDSITWEAFVPDTKPFTSPLDAWRLSGPGLRWSFHARPHAHCWFEMA